VIVQVPHCCCVCLYAVVSILTTTSVDPLGLICVLLWFCVMSLPCFLMASCIWRLEHRRGCRGVALRDGVIAIKVRIREARWPLDRCSWDSRTSEGSAARREIKFIRIWGPRDCPVPYSRGAMLVVGLSSPDYRRWRAALTLAGVAKEPSRHK
jgi:hypothetical protein